MTKTIEEMFEEKKTELKNWQYGTVYKMYDREEECEVLAGDVDRYFDKEFILQVTKQIQSNLLKEVIGTEGACIDTIVLHDVEVQSNGIIRNSKGRLIARLVDGVEYKGEHITGVADDTQKQKIFFLSQQIDELANYIMAEFPNKIKDEGACRTAIQIMKEFIKD